MFDRLAALAALLAPIAPAVAAPPPRLLHAYVGTFTTNPPPPGQPARRTGSSIDFAKGRGIYLIDIDPATGAMTHPRLVAETPSPTWLALDPQRMILYAANEAGAEAAGVSAFRIDRVTGALAPFGSARTGGSPTHIALHPSGRYLLAANYGGGSVAVLPIRADGSLGQASDIVTTIGPATPPRGPSPTAHWDDAIAAVHMVGTDHAARFVIANDAMQDRVFVWTLDLASGKLVPNDPPAFEAVRGNFPRHFAFAPDDRYFYDLDERTATLSVSAFAVVGGRARLTPLQTISTLPDDYRGWSICSELLISADGRYLYAANRGHDTITTFRVGTGGWVTRIGEVATQNDHPRSLAFDPSGRLIFSLNQRGDSISAFRIDPRTGLPAYARQSLAIDSPAAMVFLP